MSVGRNGRIPPPVCVHYPQYVGLWHEAHGNPKEAQEAIVGAARTAYARTSGDYMAALANVHCLRRGWPTA